MINSTERKLCLSGWLRANDTVSYFDPLKLQKFLFFYESFIKATTDKNYEFDHLKGYKRGPVFSNVWGDYTKNRTEFNSYADKAYKNEADMIDNKVANKCRFLVASLSDNELSSLTHQMNIWKCKADRINRGERQVALSDDDFNDDDKKFICTLDSMFPYDMTTNSEIVNIGQTYFVFSKADHTKLTEGQFDILSAVSNSKELHNPVFVDIDNEGRLIIDD